MRGLSALWVVALALVPGLGAAEVWIPLAGEAGEEVRVDLVRSSDEGVELEVALPGMSLEAVETDNGAFTTLRVAGLGGVGEPGEPELPLLSRFVEVPLGATVSVDAQVVDRVTVGLAARGLAPALYPAQLPIPKCDCEEARSWRFSYSPKAYQGVVDRETVSLRGPFTMRDHSLMLLSVSPVRYDADAGTVEVARRIRVRVEFSGGDLEATRARKQRLASRHFDSVLDRGTVNLNFGGKAAGWHYPADAPVEFLIIAPNDATMLTALEPFVAWKTSTGFNVNLVTTAVTGTTTTAIKSYIQGLYGSANPPVYILMIGDSPTPLVTFTNSGGGSGGTDLPFVQMDSDLYADMIIARWPVDNAAELIAMRDKTLWYEQPTAGNSAWLNRALYLGGDDYQGWTTHQTVIAQLMAPPPNSAECAFWDAVADNPTTAELIADLNTGRGWAVYSAHSGPDGWSGRPAFSSSDVLNPTLQNTNMYPLGFGHSCSSNEWNNYGDVFGEVTVVTANKGFVTYWGGSNSTYWDGDDWLERGFFDSMFDQEMPGTMLTLDRQYSQGAACYAGLTEVTLHGGNEQYYWYLYNLNGDPTLDPFTRQPIGMTVGTDPVVPPSSNESFTVTVGDSQGPVGGALVGVSQGGTLLGAGYTNSTGNAVFHIDAPQAGDDMLVRVTAHNHIPTDASVIVGAGSDGVVVLDRTIYRCDSVVAIDVFDEDLAGLGTIGVTLSASPSGGSTTVTLSEQGGGVVRFYGTATLGVNLAVAHGDTLTVTYHDANTGGGSAQDKTDSALLDCAGPQITAVSSSVSEASLTVTFTTDEPGTTELTYGTSIPPTTTVDDSTLQTSHSLTVSGLDPCTTYYFRVASADALGNLTVDTNGGLYYSHETAGWSVVMAETFTADPGWTVINNGNTHGWAFGVPTGGGGQYGEPDPTGGYTGGNVYGVNLLGDYDNSLTDNQLQLEAPALDCTDLTSVQLRYWRWLGVESPTFDHARVQISVDGGAWTTVRENTETMNGGSWVEESLDLTAQAAGHANVRLRWTLGPTDSSWQFAGWNLDDVRIEGAAPCTGLFADDFECGTCQNWSLMVP